MIDKINYDYYDYYKLKGQGKLWLFKINNKRVNTQIDLYNTLNNIGKYKNIRIQVINDYGNIILIKSYVVLNPFIFFNA